MPRYYFHVYDAGGVVPDEEGMTLPNLASARVEALLSLEDIIEAQPFEQAPSEDHIEIGDESGAIVMIVPGVEAIKLSS